MQPVLESGCRHLELSIHVRPQSPTIAHDKYPDDKYTELIEDAQIKTMEQVDRYCAGQSGPDRRATQRIPVTTKRFLSGIPETNTARERLHSEYGSDVWHFRRWLDPHPLIDTLIR